VLVIFGVAAVVIVPAIALLYVLDQKSLLPEEGVEEVEANDVVAAGS